MSFHRPIPIDITLKAMKCVCKIGINSERGSLYGTGFFMRISDELNYLITAHHIINENRINENITLEIWNKNILNLKSDGRYIKYFPRPIDITAIEILETDNIYKDIEFLDFDHDLNYTDYEIYKNTDIFTVQYTFGKDLTSASGNVIEIHNNMEFAHNIPTDRGSSGCPIILLDNNINILKVFGIHESKDMERKVGYAKFIFQIINEINKPIKKLNDSKIHDKTKTLSNNKLNKINNKVFIPNQSNDNNLIGNNNNIFNKSPNNIYQLNNNASNISNSNNIPLSKNENEQRKNEKHLDLTNDSKEVITLHFQSSDQLINYVVRCNLSHRFNLIANQIFEKEPKFIENGFYFLSGGKKINEYKTIKDNQLKDEDVIIIQSVD